MIAWVLSLAWGSLLATPFVVAARRDATRGRLRPLRTPRPAVSGHGVRVPVPTPVRRVAARVVGIRRDRRETDRIVRELPLVLDLLQVGVGAGSTPFRALELVVRWGPPASGSAFRVALDATQVGSSLAEALDAVATGAPALAPVTDALLTTERLGAPAGPALTRLAHDVRADLRRRAEARARTLPVKLLFPLVFLVLPAFGLLTVVPALLGALART
jgi:pilus assembly protein TadC